MLSSSLYAFVALAASVSAHSIFQELHVNGVSQGHLKGIRVPSYDGPLTDVTTNDIICNGGPNPLNYPYDPTVIAVKAGDTLTAEWHHTLKGSDPSDGDDPISNTHKGPTIAYLAKVSSATQETVTGLKWFKIHEDGLDANGVWGVDRMIANGGKHSFAIPTCIENGDYLLRVEVIALHAAGSYPGAQFYTECAQLRITGGTGTVAPATVSFPGAYKGADPGITISIYYPPLTSYTIPGPAVFKCSGTQPSTTAAVSSSTRAASSTSSTRAVSSSTSSSAPPTSTGTVPLWGQCGGSTYTGPTTCAQGTCVKLNDFYSQCTP